MTRSPATQAELGWLWAPPGLSSCFLTARVGAAAVLRTGCPGRLLQVLAGVLSLVSLPDPGSRLSLGPACGKAPCRSVEWTFAPFPGMEACGAGSAAPGWSLAGRGPSLLAQAEWASVGVGSTRGRAADVTRDRGEGPGPVCPSPGAGPALVGTQACTGRQPCAWPWPLGPHRPSSNRAALAVLESGPCLPLVAFPQLCSGHSGTGASGPSAPTATFSPPPRAGPPVPQVLPWPWGRLSAPPGRAGPTRTDGGHGLRDSRPRRPSL